MTKLPEYTDGCFELCRMDDMVFIGAGKKYMKKAFKLVINYLKEELGLELKHDNYQVIDLYREKAFVDVVG